MAKPLVGILMGSGSNMPVKEKATAVMYYRKSNFNKIE